MKKIEINTNEKIVVRITNWPANWAIKPVWEIKSGLISQLSPSADGKSATISTDQPGRSLIVVSAADATSNTGEVIEIHAQDPSIPHRLHLKVTRIGDTKLETETGSL